MSSEKLNVLSLFAGIGGLELGLERAGMTVVGQVEIDPYCRAVLEKHWPEVPRHDDVRTAAEWWLSEERPRVDVICGGFPCQPVSTAGRRLAQADERWLWPAFADTVRVLRPRYVLMENVPGLTTAGLGDVLSDLAALGYDVEWRCLSAASFGAPHLRARWFGIARPDVRRALAHSGSERRAGDAGEQRTRRATSERRQAGGHPGDSGPPPFRPADHWATEPDVGRVANGIPSRVDRLRALGNAVVPQVSEYVGSLIVEHFKALERAA